MDKAPREKFENEYKKLNPEQKKAVDTIEGPVMVVAGPGTGKTQILTMRIANILRETDTPPENILALTFTESGAASMRRRLTEIIGSAAYQVTITTFHGFANDIIQSYPDEFPEIIGSVNITDVDQIQLIRDVIDSLSLSSLRPFGDPYFYLRPLMGALNVVKREGRSPAEFRKLVEEERAAFEMIEDLRYESGAHEGKLKGKYADIEKHLKRNEEFAVVYEAYQHKLRASRRYDYSDMILEVMRALERNSELLLTLQERYLYILVDEHQDTNSAQNRILELLASYFESPNLFVVGDPKQAIFRFQGASLENFNYFGNRYKNVALITLQGNYRSTQTILDAARSLRPDSEALRAHAGHEEKPIHLLSFSTPEVERYFIAEDIKRRIEGGVSPERIAVLYRENRDAGPLAHTFELSGVPFIVESEEDVFRDKDIQKLLLLFKAIQRFGSGEELLRALIVDFLEIKPLDLYKLSLAAHKGKKNPYDIIGSMAAMEELGVENTEALAVLNRKLSAWKSAVENSDAVHAFEFIVRDSGFLEHLLHHSMGEQKLAKLHALFDQVKLLLENHKDLTLEDFFSYLDVVKEHEILLTSPRVHLPGRVHCMTAHKSKGLEFDVVYVVNAIEGRWGGRRHAEHLRIPKRIYGTLEKAEDRFSGTSDEDERNLFYVALTRARREAIITCAERGADGREQLPSKFVSELKPELVVRENTEIDEKEFEKQKGIAFAAPKTTAPLLEDKEFLNRLFLDHGLSVSALNNYLLCPWKYFFTNLIRIPEAPNKYAMFGSAVHDALKSYFMRFLEGEKKDEEYLVRRFKESLFRQPIDEKDFEEMYMKGAKALEGYYAAHREEWGANKFSVEWGIDGISLSDKVKINGRLDKVEFLDDTPHVRVIDYKTGKPKSRNEIEGKTKGSDGNYKRQLIFYHLLLDMFENGKYKMTLGEISFVEPDERGKYHSELFEITPEEVAMLRDQVLAVSDEILNLSFWDKQCDDPKCEYCDLRNKMESR